MRLFQGARPVTRAGAVRDALAGVQMAAMNIPQVLGYTRIAGTSVVSGLYTLLLPLVAFAVFGSSRYLVVAADSATAAILAGGLAGMAPLASARYMALASMVALLTAGFLLLARLLRLGFLADFLPQTVLVGFLTGVGVQVGIAELGDMFGVDVHARSTVLQLVEVLRRLPQGHFLTAVLSSVVVGAILILHRVSPKVPAASVAVIGAIAASAAWNFEGRGVAVIGRVAGGLPHLAWPAVAWDDLPSLLPIAGACFVMILTQSAATARFYAGRHQQRLDEEADLVGLSAANAAAAVSGTFVVDGSPIQTAMVEASGGRSQLTQVAAAVVAAAVLQFLMSPLQYLPRGVLGAVVFVIAVRLVDVRGLRDIRRESRDEFVLALLTAAVVVLIGVEQGIVIAMVLSLLRVVAHSYRPQTGVLVLGEQGTWELRSPTLGKITEPGLVVYRFGAALFYANASRFAAEVRNLAQGNRPPLRCVVVDAEAITNIDYTAARMVEELARELARGGVALAFARAASSLQADFVRHRLVNVIGSERIFPHLHDALAAFAEGNTAPPQALETPKATEE